MKHRKQKKIKTGFIPKDYFGAVYLIFNSLSSQYKIGITSVSPNKRKSAIETQSGMRLDLVDWWEMDTFAPTAEAMLHTYFEKYRTIGEWFAFPEVVREEEIRSKIERLLNGSDSYLDRDNCFG